MQAASSNYAKLIFFPKALGKKKVISRSFTVLEKEKGHQIIAKKSHTVLSNVSHSTSSLNLLQHHAVCFYKKSNKEMEAKVALNILFLFSILLIQGSYVEGILGKDTRPVNNLI